MNLQILIWHKYNLLPIILEDEKLKTLDCFILTQVVCM